jgi:uncharacterized coiled-coil DUF342 family protein
MHPDVAHDLNDADEQILGWLIQGRNLPQNLADELDYSRQYVQNRLQMLKAADLVENLGGGLYEITDDGRDKFGTGAESRDELRDASHNWKNKWHNTHQELSALEEELEEIREERDELEAEVARLQQDSTTPRVDVDRLEMLLDQIETAAERGDGDALKNAVDDARDVLDS